MPSDFRQALAGRGISLSDQIRDKNIVYQDITDFLPNGFDLNDRTKPWGTAHALLVVKNHVHENFLVFNADDLYGYEQTEDRFNGFD